eukprot:6490526-Amphidinium_carterae.1
MILLAAATKLEEWQKHHRKGHINKIPDCPGCQLKAVPRLFTARLPSLTDNQVFYMVSKIRSVMAAGVAA